MARYRRLSIPISKEVGQHNGIVFKNIETSLDELVDQLNQEGATLSGTETLINKTLTAPTIATPVISGDAISSGRFHVQNSTTLSATPTTAFLVGSASDFGVYAGSGAPSFTAGKGSMYMRIDGSSGTSRAYINTTGGTAWTAITTGT